MTTFVFDRESLRKALAGLGPSAWTTFAGCCVERYWQHLTCYLDRTVRQTQIVPIYERARSELWSAAIDGYESKEIAKSVSLLESNLPDGDEASLLQCYEAEYVAEALCYGLRSVSATSPLYAVMSANSIFDLVDSWIQRASSIQKSSSGFVEIENHPLMKMELGYQHRDLDDLIARTDVETLNRLKQRAIAASEFLMKEMQV